MKRRKRKCGNCQVCCEAVGVVTLDKPKFQPCRHQCPTGCAIYSERPEECAIYRCSYLDRTFRNESLRPDRCGVLAETLHWNGLDIAFVYEAEKGSGATHDVKELLKREVRPGLLVMCSTTQELFASDADGDQADVFLAMLKSGQLTLKTRDGVLMKL